MSVAVETLENRRLFAGGPGFGSGVLTITPPGGNAGAHEVTLNHVVAGKGPAKAAENSEVLDWTPIFPE